MKKIDNIITIKGYTIKGHNIRGYTPEFSITKNLTFSVQKKLVDTSEKVADRLANTLKKIKPLKF